jgi:hypothetical protein
MGERGAGPDEAAVRTLQYILDETGEPVPCPDLFKWAAFLGDIARRTVAKTVLADGTRVSTIFLGTDHQFGDGPPLLFETMIFHGDPGTGDECWRYPTRAEALEGHAAAVAGYEEQVAARKAAQS